MCGRDPERARRAVDPARWPFDLAEVSNRSLIEHHLARAVAPLCAVFFIAKGRSESKRTQNGIHLLAVLDTRFQFNPHFMAARPAFRLVRQYPGLAVLPQPQQFATLAQLLAGQVVE